MCMLKAYSGSPSISAPLVRQFSTTDTLVNCEAASTLPKAGAKPKGRATDSSLLLLLSLCNPQDPRNTSTPIQTINPAFPAKSACQAPTPPKSHKQNKMALAHEFPSTLYNRYRNQKEPRPKPGALSRQKRKFTTNPCECNILDATPLLSIFCREQTRVNQ
jgi:hypothetical protein